MTSRSKMRSRNIFGQIPAFFISNQGQLKQDGIQFYSKGLDYDAFFMKKGVSFIFTEQISSKQESALDQTSDQMKQQKYRLDFHLVNGNKQLQLEARKEISGKINYFREGNSYTDLTLIQEIIYREVWPGIDLVFKIAERQIKYEFIVHAGAKIEKIRYSYKGVKKTTLDESGNLILETPIGDLVDTSPESYQVKNSKKHNIQSVYKMITGEENEQMITFSMGNDYDLRYPLIIDPGLIYSTYLGGSASDAARCIEVDSGGHAYVAGSTDSVSIPTTPGVYEDDYKEETDVFVVKMDSTGSNLLYATYLGGEGTDQAFDIALDSGGNAYVVGSTNSLRFPTSENAYDNKYNGSEDIFVLKLNPTGNDLIYSTYLGGSDFDSGRSIVVDASGFAYVTGLTFSSDFAKSEFAFDDTLKGRSSAFVTKLNQNGTDIVYSTYLGGESDDEGTGIAVDSTGHAYITGTTDSTQFPTSKGAYSRKLNMFLDTFVTKLNPSGTDIVYSTYLGGSSADSGTSIALDYENNAYITGYTHSNNFPTTANAHKRTLSGLRDAFVVKLNSTGTSLIYSTYLGGSSSTEGLHITVDSEKNFYVTGVTNSEDFPTTNKAYSGFNGFEDAFVTKFNEAGTIVYSTCLGGASADCGYGIAVDQFGNVYVAGATFSQNFPTSDDALSRERAGPSDAFVTKLSTISLTGKLSLNISLMKGVRVQSDVALNVQGRFCEPRSFQQVEYDKSFEEMEKELTCIRTNLVHDWVVSGTDVERRVMIPENCLRKIAACQNREGNVSFYCEPLLESSNFTILDRNDNVSGVPGASIVHFRITVPVRIQSRCYQELLCEFEAPITLVDRIILYYPLHSSIIVNIYSAQCYITSEMINS